MVKFLKKKTKCKHVKELLKYSFVNNSILLSTETIKQNGFQEVWRQQGENHSIQILCFNEKTGEFQAFDRFHWMHEPFDEPFTGIYGVYDKDLWTPIKFHFTEKWLKEHLLSD